MLSVVPHFSLDDAGTCGLLQPCDSPHRQVVNGIFLRAANGECLSWRIHAQFGSTISMMQTGAQHHQSGTDLLPSIEVGTELVFLVVETRWKPLIVKTSTR